MALAQPGQLALIMAEESRSDPPPTMHNGVLMSIVESTSAPPAQSAHHRDPAQIYAARQEQFANDRDRLTKRWNRIANLRLLAFVAAVVCIIFAMRLGSWPLAIVGGLLLIAFLILVQYHVRLGNLRKQAEERRAINQEAAWRLTRDWQHLPLRSTYRAQATHPYADDLDLFGPASLFHLLYPGGTPRGEATLRAWLLDFAKPTAIQERQQAVAELAAQIDLRDELQMAGRLTAGATRDPEPFLRWAEGAPWLRKRPFLILAARLSPLLFWLLLILWLTGIVPIPFWFIFFLINLGLTIAFNGQLSRLLGTLTEQEGGFQHYASSFAVLDHRPFTSPLLARLLNDLRATGLSAYRQMQRLERLCRLIIPPSALANAFLQPLFLWNFHVLHALEGWQQQAGPHARQWLVILGEIEALAALGSLAHAQPAWAFPQVAEITKAFAATALGHPLLADTERVANDVTVGPPGSFLLVTGSNMSGKSTLLRAIGTNAVLAGAGGPVCAESLQLPPVRLWTSMRINDSLAQGVSYYMAELRRLKAVVDGARAAQQAASLPLYLLDEILQGTNTHERQIAARRIIAHLVQQGAIGAVSTHDLQLAETPVLAATARPIHFSEEFHSGPAGPTMTFDYRARPGLATSTNALRLMEIIGLDLDPDEDQYSGEEG